MAASGEHSLNGIQIFTSSVISTRLNVNSLRKVTQGDHSSCWTPATGSSSRLLLPSAYAVFLKPWINRPPPEAHFRTRPVQNSCQAPFSPQFPLSLSLQPKYKLPKHGTITLFNLLL